MIKIVKVFDNLTEDFSSEKRLVSWYSYKGVTMQKRGRSATNSQRFAVNTKGRSMDRLRPCLTAKSKSVGGRNIRNARRISRQISRKFCTEYSSRSQSHAGHVPFISYPLNLFSFSYSLFFPVHQVLFLISV